MFKRIGTKILVLFILNVIGWVSLLCFFFYSIATRSLEKQVDDTLRSTATVLASQWDGSLLMPLLPGMEHAALYRSFSERLKLLKKRTQLEGIYIVALNRTNIVSSQDAMRIGQPLPRLDLLQNEFGSAIRGEVSATRLVKANDHQYKSAFAPIYSANKVAAILMVDMSPQYLIYLRSFRNSLLLFSAIAFCCCALSARLFSRTITDPIARMVRSLEGIGQAQYEQPLEIKGSDELAVLASTIETMRENILSRDVRTKMMLSGIAHEIRNPLGGIELFTGILEKENLQGREREYVRKITTEIQNLKRLLNEFLEFARPGKLEYEHISLSDLIADIHSLLEEELRQKDATWNVEIQPDVESIKADPFRLKQALINLYRNAFQAIPPGGEVLSQMARNGHGIILKISNTQLRPIDPEVQSKLFEPFFTTKEKGIGLGLPLAKRIIEAHGGEIHLEENSASRITFAIELPS